jgi:5-methylcytosine-specific restriction endonuclease McrBC regulatory subunit McrC
MLAYGYRLKKSKGTFLLEKCDNNDDAERQKQRLVELEIHKNNIRIHPDNV